MRLKSNPTIKTLMVTLSTSAYEVPSESLESLGRYQGKIWTDTIVNREWRRRFGERYAISLSQANFTNDLVILRKNKG